MFANNSTPLILFLALAMALLFAGASTTSRLSNKLKELSKTIETSACLELVNYLDSSSGNNLRLDKNETTPSQFSCMTSLKAWNDLMAGATRNATRLLNEGLKRINYTGPFLETKGLKDIEGNSTDTNNTDFDDDDDYDSEEYQLSYELKLPEDDGVFDNKLIVLCVLVVVIILFQTYMIGKEAVYNAQQDALNGRHHTRDLILDLGPQLAKHAKYEGMDPDDSEEEIELLVRGSEEQCSWGSR